MAGLGTTTGASGVIDFVIPDARLLAKNKRVYSSPVHVRNLKWTVFAMLEESISYGKPKLNFSAYLECDSTFSSWTCKTDLDFRFVPWSKSINPVKKESTFLFTELCKSAGFPNIISLQKLLDPANGYIAPATFTVALQVLFQPELPLINTGIYNCAIEKIHGLEDKLSGVLKFVPVIAPASAKMSCLETMLVEVIEVCKKLSSIPSATDNTSQVQQTYLLNNTDFGNMKVKAADHEVEFYAEEEALIRTSPLFLKLLDSSDRDEKLQRSYTFENSSPACVLDFLLYCYLGVVPRLGEIAKELVVLGTNHREERLKTMAEVFVLRDLLQLVVNFNPTVTNLSKFIEYGLKYHCDMVLAGVHLSLQERFADLSIAQQEEWRHYQRNVPEFIFKRLDFAVAVQSSLTKQYVEQERTSNNYWEQFRGEGKVVKCWK